MPIEVGKIYILGKRPKDYTKVKVISVKVLNKDRVVVYKDICDNSTHIAPYSGFNMWINVKETEKLEDEDEEKEE